MKVLAIETSCDETSASVVTNENKSIQILSNITVTSLSIHATTGGIIPEDASREQLKFIIPTITETLLESRKISVDKDQKTNWRIAREIISKDIDAIALTYGPGLISSLLVGVETAKTLSYAFAKPIIPINHLLAHIYANYIGVKDKTISFPFIGLIVSGGHTDLLYFKSHKEYKWLGGTRDDAAGEAFDKIGRMLGFSYPAGPEIEKRAIKVALPTIKFQSPLMYSKDFDFSFSGLKAEAMRYIQKHPERNEETINQICYATQKAIIDVLVKKTFIAAEKYRCSTILVGGGVSANQTMINQLKLNAKRIPLNPQIFSPEKIYCTDNAAMVGTYALMNSEIKPWKEINANPELYFS